MSVALVLIPQSLAYATLAGLPPEQGLIAATVAPLAAAIFASSPYLQTGPTALTSLLTLGALSALAQPLSPEYVGLAVLLALLVGAFRLITGLVRAGALAYLMSQPVLLGFASAAAILIVASQVPAALGARVHAANPIAAAAAALSGSGGFDPAALSLALLAAGVVVGARRLHRLLPGALIAIVGATAASVVLGYQGRTVGPIDSAVLSLSSQLPWGAIPHLLVPALIIALIGFAEPAAIARRYATADRQAWDPNREFVSQGVANVVAAAAGGMPVGGSFSRTALGRYAGARSRWSSAFTSLVVLATLPVAFLLAPLPAAVLAAIVITSVAGLVDLRSFGEYWRLSRVQAIVGLATFGSTLALAPHVELGVLVGIGAAIAAHLWREEQLAIRAWLEGDALHLRPHGVLYFVSAPAFEDLAGQRLASYPQARRLVIHVDGLGRVDVTGAMAIRELLADAREAGLEVGLEDVPSHAMRVITRALGEDVPISPTPGHDLRAPLAAAGAPD